MQIALREPTLARRVEQWAQETSQQVEKVLETAVQSHLDELEEAAIHAETRTFWAMHDELLEKYSGQHVALFRGQVIDHDRDASRLGKRMRKRFDSLPVLIAPVRPGPRRDLRWLGGRFDRSEVAK